MNELARSFDSPSRMVRRTDWELTRRAAFGFQQRDAMRRAEPRRGSAGPTNGRASGAATSWPARAVAVRAETLESHDITPSAFGRWRLARKRSRPLHYAPKVMWASQS